MEAVREYKSAVDWWIGAVLVFAAAMVPLLLALAIIGFGRDYVGTAILAVSAAMMAAILSGLVYPVRYTTTPDRLIVQSGMVKYRIDYPDISTIEPTRAAWSSPALSLDRLKVKYGNSWLMISPAERKQFLEDIQRRAPQLHATSEGGLAAS